MSQKDIGILASIGENAEFLVDSICKSRGGQALAFAFSSIMEKSATPC